MSSPSACASAARQVLVIGASRGIGLEFVRQYLAAGEQVTATARSEEGLQALQALGAQAVRLDVSAADASAALLRDDAARYDTVLLCAGAYGPRTHVLEPPSAQEFDAVMHSNVLGAMQLLPRLAERLAPQARLAVLSSRMASIGERNTSAGWLYRASKAALNSVLRDTALNLAGRAVCVSFHPGWVRTDMGGAGADLDVATSVSDMRHVLEQLTPGDNGRFLNHDGSAIAW